MSNIAKILKETIDRVARKHAREETHTLRKASIRYRKDIADLAARVKELERKLSLLAKRAPASAGAGQMDSGDLRFSAKGLQSLRKRLGLSATECGMLVGVSGHSIGKWERGESRPQGEQLSAVAALRRMGRREARMRIGELAEKNK